MGGQRLHLKVVALKFILQEVPNYLRAGTLLNFANVKPGSSCCCSEGRAKNVIVAFLVVCLICQTLSKPVDQVTDVAVEQQKQSIQKTESAPVEKTEEIEEDEGPVIPRSKRRASFNGRKFIGFVAGK